MKTSIHRGPSSWVHIWFAVSGGASRDRLCATSGSAVEETGRASPSRSHTMAVP